jgi:hypothetical protein
MLEEFEWVSMLLKGHAYIFTPYCLQGKCSKLEKPVALGFTFDFRLSLIAWDLFFNILNSNNSNKYLVKFEIASRPVCWRQEKLFEEKT